MQTLSKLRLANFTASKAVDLFTGGATAEAYIAEKAEEAVTGRQKLFGNKDTDHGLMHEYEGLEAFAEVTGLLVKHLDQKYFQINENCGATPDAQVEDFSGRVLASVDMKCPTKTFFKQKMMFINGQNAGYQNVPKGYFFQAQVQMLAMSKVLGYEVKKHYLVRYLTAMDIDDDGNKIEYDLPLETRIFYKIVYKDDFIQQEFLRKVSTAAMQRDQLIKIYKQPII